MVTAGLCHDIDHRGTNNLYQMKCVQAPGGCPGLGGAPQRLQTLAPKAGHPAWLLEIL